MKTNTLNMQSPKRRARASAAPTQVRVRKQTGRWSHSAQGRGRKRLTMLDKPGRSHNSTLLPVPRARATS